MTRSIRRAAVLAAVAGMVLAMIAPATAGVAAAAADLAVTTDEPTDVTETSATLHGNLTDLGNATDAAVSFAYWEDGDADNATDVDAGEVNATGAFEATVDDLAPNTSYVVVAEANASGAVVTGENVTFETDDAFDVRTDAPADVTNSSATLRGELVDLDGAENATVWFEYRQEGDANATSVGEQTLNGAGGFAATVDGLEENETYVYVAHAESADGDAEEGSEVTFVAVVEDQEDEWEDEDLAFGQRVSSYVHSLFGVTFDGSFGAYVSEWVTANNPGADNKPDHAGPDGERGPPDHATNSTGDGDDERGPPEHANNGKDDGEAGSEGDESEDDERGPPAHANNDKGDDDDDGSDEDGSA